MLVGSTPVEVVAPRATKGARVPATMVGSAEVPKCRDIYITAVIGRRQFARGKVPLEASKTLDTATVQESGPMRIIYICHPFGGDPAGNAESVRRICAGLKARCVPLAPHLLLPAYIDESTERDLALRHCIRLVAVADEVRVYGEPTEGMQLEIAEAKRLRKPIVFVADRKRDDPQVKLEAVRE